MHGIDLEKDLPRGMRVVRMRSRAVKLDLSIYSLNCSDSGHCRSADSYDCLMQQFSAENRRDAFWCRNFRPNGTMRRVAWRDFVPLIDQSSLDIFVELGHGPI